MERFVVLLTTTERTVANRACEGLEHAGIPVMLEHVEIHDGATRASGYRLLVPSEATQAARRLTDSVATELWFTRSNPNANLQPRPLWH